MASFKSEDIGKKSKAVDEAATITSYIAYLGVGIGGFSLMHVAIMISFLFKIIKKLIYINTAYGEHMLKMLNLMNGDLTSRKDWMFKPMWYNYRN